MGRLDLCSCGNKPRLTHVFEPVKGRLKSWALVVCDKCGTVTDKSYEMDDEAVEAWNRRDKNGTDQ